jgi:integral membrane protein (TIGR00529 family)
VPATGFFILAQVDMIDIFRITLVFIVLLVFLRLRWNVGYVLLIASGMLAFLYGMSFQVMMTTVKSTLADPVTAKLFFALTLIKVLELVLREKHVLARMTEASRDFLKKKKAVIISMPMLIGLLPSIGGAYFSAPMVEESTKDLHMSPEEKGFINYWFRHPWEYVLPLYPGVLLAAAISGLELRRLIIANSIYAVLIVLTGFLFGLKGVEERYRRPEEKNFNSDARKQTANGRTPTSSILRSGLLSFTPIAIILFLVIVFHVELHYALGVTIFFLFAFYRYKPAEAFRALKHGFTLDVIVLIFGAMIFKFTMENSGAVVRLSRYFTAEGIPLLPVLFLLPFVSGLLTGLTVGFVGSTFPLIISLAGGAHLHQIVFAFVSGYMGVLLSPVHLCLVLTREYFKADIWGIYRKTLPASLIVLAGAFIVYAFP